MILQGDPFGWQVDADATAITIGVFDGVHRGHQRVMKDLTAMARDRGLVPVALTFDPHPWSFWPPTMLPIC
jgi:riboflavin kinase / FMN adenylyltransferase